MGDDACVVRLDRFERGAVLLALAEKRNLLIKEGRPTDTVNDAIIKVTHAPVKKRRGRDEAR
jgi:hypothetical protein